MNKKTKGQKRQRSQSVSVPAAQGRRNRISKPRFHYNAEGNLCIAHREYVADILSDVANEFAYDVYVLNPADPTTFPWLSVIAARFEWFRFKRLNVSSESASPTNMAGKILLAVDYDAADDTTFGPKAQMLQWGGAVDGNVWDTFTHVSDPVDLQAMGPWRATNETLNEDSPEGRMTSAGNLFVAATAVSPNYALSASPTPVYPLLTLAELFIDYEVELRTPVLHLGSTSAAETADFLLSTYVQTTTATVPTDLLAGMPSPEIAVENGILLEPANAQSRNGGTGSTPAIQWLDAASGALVNGATNILKFTKDFVGSVEFTDTYNTTSSNANPYVTSVYSTADPLTVRPLIPNPQAPFGPGGGIASTPQTVPQTPRTTVIESGFDWQPALNTVISRVLANALIWVDAKAGSAISLLVNPLLTSFAGYAAGSSHYRQVRANKNAWTVDLLRKKTTERQARLLLSGLRMDANGMSRPIEPTPQTTTLLTASAELPTLSPLSSPGALGVVASETPDVLANEESFCGFREKANKLLAVFDLTNAVRDLLVFTLWENSSSCGGEESDVYKQMLARHLTMSLPNLPEGKLVVDTVWASLVRTRDLSRSRCV